MESKVLILDLLETGDKFPLLGDSECLVFVEMILMNFFGVLLQALCEKSSKLGSTIGK